MTALDDCIVQTKRSSRACKQYLVADLVAGLLFCAWLATHAQVVGIVTIVSMVVALFMRHRWWRAEDARLREFDRFVKERQQINEQIRATARELGIEVPR